MSESPAPLTDPAGSKNPPSLGARLRTAWELEFSNLRWRLLICVFFARMLPANRAAALRTALIRGIGLDIGSGTRFRGTPKLTSSPGPLRSKLRIGANCTFGTRVILEFGDILTIGDRVTIADGVVILTTSHQIGPKEHRAGPIVRHPVVIGRDAVIAADAIILPGTTIGDGARVLANSVVTASVAPGVTVSGIPARPLRAI